MARQTKASLSDQCLSVGWSISEVLAQKHDKRSWSLGGAPPTVPEEVVAQMFINEGHTVSFCEGGSVLLLMKAAALEALARLNIFSDREDAVTRYLEAQMTILADHTNEIVETVRTISPEALARNVHELCGNACLMSFFPRVTERFLLKLFEHIGNEQLAKLLLLFSAAPYEYRAGWPDLIVLKGSAMRLVEVKTSDKLLDSQLRFATGIAKPMGFDCGVVRLKAMNP